MFGCEYKNITLHIYPSTSQKVGEFRNRKAESNWSDSPRWIGIVHQEVPSLDMSGLTVSDGSYFACLKGAVVACMFWKCIQC